MSFWMQEIKPNKIYRTLRGMSLSESPLWEWQTSQGQDEDHERLVKSLELLAEKWKNMSRSLFECAKLVEEAKENKRLHDLARVYLSVRQELIGTLKNGK